MRILGRTASRVVLGIAAALGLFVSSGATQAQEQSAFRFVDNSRLFDANDNLVGFVIAPLGKPGGSDAEWTVAFVLGEALFLVDLTPNNFIGTEAALLFPTTDCTGTAYFMDRQPPESNGYLFQGTLAKADFTVFVVDRSDPFPTPRVTHRSGLYSQPCRLFQLEQVPVRADQAELLVNLNSLFRPPFKPR